MDDYRRKKLPQNRNLIDSFQDEFYKKFQRSFLREFWFTETDLKKVSWSQICMSRLRASVIAMAQREKTITAIDSDY